jgi:hypothetical protein
MDPKTVEKLEDRIEIAIAEIVGKMGLKGLPLLPSHQTMHLMAKAAVAVYEAAVETRRTPDILRRPTVRRTSLCPGIWGTACEPPLNKE